jgi:hypothetical protein
MNVFHGEKAALPQNGDVCQCMACGKVFNSTSAFDRHRTGEHGANRRCMTADEMRNGNGRERQGAVGRKALPDATGNRF